MRGFYKMIYNVIKLNIPSDIYSEKHSSISVKLPIYRFLEFTDEAFTNSFDTAPDIFLEKIKDYPALIFFDNFEFYIALCKIKKLSIDKKNKQFTATFHILKKIYSNKKFFHEIDPREDTQNFYDLNEQLAQKLSISPSESQGIHWSIKEGDIFSIFEQFFALYDLIDFRKEFPILNQKMTQTVNAIGTSSTEFGFQSVSNLTTDEKNNFSIINHVSDFIKEVVIKIEELNKEKEYEVFFRGHSKDSYRLTPSLFRSFGTKGKIYERSEHILYRELITAEPSFFNQEPAAIDTLTRMQHYGMPTRLLDISSNPLTALYFATEHPNDHFDLNILSSTPLLPSKNEIVVKNYKYHEKIYSTGEVILFFIKKNAISFYDSDKVTCISNIVKLNSNQKDHIEKLIIKTPQLPPNDKICKQYLHFIQNEKSYFKPQIQSNDLKKIICVKGKKIDKRIQAQSGSFLLFGYEHELDTATNPDINIFKFKIKYKDKSTILKELDLLGINKSTIYPNIENSAKYIKERLESHS